MIVLASQSASRKAMLTSAGVDFVAIPAQLDERMFEESLDTNEPEHIARALAKAKALAIEPPDNGQLILGSDSLVTVDGQRFDKPTDRHSAADHLRYFSGRQMKLHSAAALVRHGSVIWSDCMTATLHVRDLSEPFIESYLDAEWPEVGYCVGVFRIEAMGVQLFERIEGDHFTVLGMPLLPVLAQLRQLGELEQ
ncbi:MAG: Maf family protein [Novosphingobium sp.]|nr:Maf family protein [Novosphingobium sp.]